MADNLSLTQGSGALLSTDDILGVHVLRAKVQIGADGAADDVSADNPLPVTIGAPLPAGTNTIGSVGLAPATSGGLAIFKVAGLVNTGQLIKNTAGQVFGWHISFVSGGIAPGAGVYVKLYDTSSAPTVGTDIPVMTIYVPSGATSAVHHGNGLAFSAGIGIAATVAMGDADTTSPGADAVVANIFYK